MLKRPQLATAPGGRGAASPASRGPARVPQAGGRDVGGADAGKAGTEGEATEHPPGFLGIARSVFDRFGNDNISLVAAGVAFYVMLSIFPALAAHGVALRVWSATRTTSPTASRTTATCCRPPP